MGLFDIFKRKQKKSDTTEPESTAVISESPSATPVSEVELSSNTAQAVASAMPQSQSATSATSTPASEVTTVASEPVNLEGPVSSVQDTVESDQSDDEPVEKQPSQSAASIVEPTSVETNANQENESHNEASEDTGTDNKYEQGLAKTRTGFGARLNALLANFRHVDEDFFENLEEALIESDVGFEMAETLSDQLREEVKLQNAKNKQAVTNVIIEKMVDLYEQQGKDEHNEINFAPTGPTVILFVGVNGVGKTTTIGKMAAMYQQQGKKVLLAAADTFRAGAIQQLQVWGKRDHVPVVTGPEKGDPAAVVFDAVERAKQENYDILFVDTAGRLQNKVNLMNELAKMKRIISREIPDAPHEVLLVLDATTGQNALSQAKLFKESTDVTGIVLTKLDGTARGGIVLAIRNELHLPVKYVGLGEKVSDLQKFDASEFVYGLFKGLVEPTD